MTKSRCITRVVYLLFLFIRASWKTIYESVWRSFKRKNKLNPILFNQYIILLTEMLNWYLRVLLLRIHQTKNSLKFLFRCDLFDIKIVHRREYFFVVVAKLCNDIVLFVCVAVCWREQCERRRDAIKIIFKSKSVQMGWFSSKRNEKNELKSKMKSIKLLNFSPMMADCARLIDKIERLSIYQIFSGISKQIPLQQNGFSILFPLLHIGNICTLFMPANSHCFISLWQKPSSLFVWFIHFFIHL